MTRRGLEDPAEVELAAAEAAAETMEAITARLLIVLGRIGGEPS